MERYSLTSGFQAVESDSPLKLFATVCICWCQHCHSRFTNRIQASIEKKKKNLKKSDFKLAGKNKCFYLY